jgi:hypothetical protein
VLGSRTPWLARSSIHYMNLTDGICPDDYNDNHNNPSYLSWWYNKKMVAALAERIGGHLSTQLLSQVLEQMQSAPVVDFGDKLEQMRIMAFDQLDHRQKIEPIWRCLDAWLEVGKKHPRRAWNTA